MKRGRRPHQIHAGALVASDADATAGTLVETGSCTSAFDRPIRVGVMLDSLAVPAWIAKILRGVASRECVDFALVVLNPEPLGRKPRSALRPLRRPQLFNLYQRIDARLFRAEPDALAEVDMTDQLRSVPTLALPPLRQTRVEHPFADGTLNKLRKADLDVLLRLGLNPVRGEALNCVRYGVWSYHHGANQCDRCGPAFFWEMYERNPVSETVLEVLTGEMNSVHVLYRSYSATDFASLHRSRNCAFWKNAEFVTRRLSDLHRWGWDCLQRLPGSREAGRCQDRIYRTPTNRQMVWFVLGLMSRAIAGKAHTLAGRHLWYVAYRRITPDEGLVSEMVSPRAKPRPATFRLIHSPSGHYYADPFVVEDAGRHYLFFEDYDVVRKKGVISATLFDEQGSLSPPQPVLERDYHLSYPFVFPWDGDWYMVPETLGNRAIELYRATEFPTQWTFERVLLADLDAVDPTILVHGERWWLFANVAVHGASVADELFLFHADSLLGAWTPHPMNPIVSDVRRARPAGRVISQNGILIRPGQDSSRRYGYATVFNRITALTPTEYEETPIHRLEPGWMSRNLASHTFNADAEYEVVDAFRHSFKCLPAFRRRCSHGSRPHPPTKLPAAWILPPQP